MKPGRLNLYSESTGTNGMEGTSAQADICVAGLLQTNLRNSVFTSAPFPDMPILAWSRPCYPFSDPINSDSTMGSAVPRVQILGLPSKIFSMDHLAENGKIEDSALTFGQAWSRITRDLVSNKGPGNVHTEEHGTVGVFHEFKSKERDDKRSHWNVHCESGNP